MTTPNTQAGVPLRLEHDKVEGPGGWFRRIYLVPEELMGQKDGDFGLLEIHEEGNVQAEEMYFFLEIARFAVAHANVSEVGAALSVALAALPEDNPHLQRLRAGFVDEIGQLNAQH
ncbi:MULTISPECIES: hypothetical protein [unclassified Paraburkholderia]|uniref:hypothetical protein n=1 Tax=unclassified Paraburkholderia TaxID=2615204 RepID=UPI002AAF2B25|nr:MULTISPECIES: hypothetical protein [unclassified Paraburkholderia]